ncbi:MAG TPA: hypothetical protein VL614_23965 [Acetobacteraceae bacterium]|nr:hypothetical protein [Acetobacteraceae bacterium]
MSDAAPSADLPPPSRSGHLLSLVRMLWDYGRDLSRTLRQRHPSNDNAALRRTFRTTDIVLILTRIAVGMRRARLLEEKIIATASRIDAFAQPEPEPCPRPRAVTNTAQPRARKLAQPQERRPTDTLSLLVRLPTADKIARKVLREPIGAVLADICRDMGICRGHPLWDELHAAITEFGGGGFVRRVRDRLNQAFPIAHLVERLKTRPEASPEPASTGPPPAPA